MIGRAMFAAALLFAAACTDAEPPTAAERALAHDQCVKLLDTACELLCDDDLHAACDARVDAICEAAVVPPMSEVEYGACSDELGALAETVCEPGAPADPFEVTGGNSCVGHFYNGEGT